MSDNHESHTPDSTEPGSSTSMVEIAVTDLGAAHSAPSLVCSPIYHNFLPVAHDINNDYAIFQSHQQPNTDTEDILPELVGGVAVVPAESAADNQPTESSMASQNLQTSQDIHDDVENILPELAMVPYTGATSLIGGYQTTPDYTIIQSPQLIHTNAVHTPSLPPVPVIGSTATSLAYPFISIGHLQQALISAFEMNTNISASYGNPVGFIDALVPNFVGMWGGAMHQSIACMDARRFRRVPSGEEVVTFIEGLEKIDVERLESNDRECGICRGKTSSKYHFLGVAANQFVTLRTLRGSS